MWIYAFFFKTPSAFEGRLIVGFLSIFSVVIGVVALIVAARAPLEKRAAAEELAVQGGGSIAFGLAVWGVCWLIGRWRDYD